MLEISLTGRVVVVAGGAGALGRAVCRACLDAGARVVMADRHAEALEGAARDLSGGNALTTVAGEANDAAGADRILTAGAALGPVGGLVTTVGGWEGGKPLWETDPASYDRMLAVNLRTAFLLARAAVPHLLRQGGALVAIASVAAHGGQAGAAPYAASKAGLLALLSSLRLDLRGKGVRVNAVLPDTMDTEANRRAMPQADFTRWVKVGDVARVIAFLLSDAGRAVNGAELPVTAS